MISLERYQYIPEQLVSELLLINHYSSNITDFLENTYKLLCKYLSQKGIKILNGDIYFFDVTAVKFKIIKKGTALSEKFIIDFDRNISDTYQVHYCVKKILKEIPFLCIVAKDNLISGRIQGIILLALAKDIPEEKHKNAIEFSQSFSTLISELFSLKYKNYIENIISKIYSDCSLVKGFKEKPMLYQILGGIRSIIPFDHSATFLLFNPNESKLQIYTERISRANPVYEKDKKIFYGEQYYNFNKEQFKNLSNKTQIISLEDLSYKWLKRIVNYKSYPIKHILLKKVQHHMGSDYLDNNSLLGLLILCNYTDTPFTNGDMKMLNYFLGGENNKHQPYKFLSFMHRIRQNFYGMTYDVPLKRSTKMKDIEGLIKSFEKDIENYLTKIFSPLIPPYKGEEQKKIKFKVFFTSRSRAYGTLLTLPRKTQKYLCSEVFSKKVTNSFYGILHTTQDLALKKPLLAERWKTLTAIKIPKSQELKYLCILKNEFVDISFYERLTLKFLAEHVGLALFDFSLLHVSRKTMEYLKEITNIGVANPSLPAEEYFNKLLKIAIDYTGSDSGNIYILNKKKKSLQLQCQEGKGKKFKTLNIHRTGVVPYVATHYEGYKNNPFNIDDIQYFRKTMPEIGYIPALEGMSSELAMQMFLGDELWGVLNLESKNKGNYDERKEYIISNICQKASEIWQQTQLSYALLKTGEFLDETAKQFIPSEEPDIYKICRDQINELLNITVKATSAHSTTFRHLDDTGQILILCAQSKGGKKSVVRKISYKNAPNCIVWTAINRGETIDIPDVNNINREQYPNTVYYKTKEGTKAEFAKPIKVLNRIDGVLNIEGDHSFREYEKFIFITVANLIELLLNHRTYLKRRTIFDHATKISLGIHKWTGFKARTEELMRNFSDKILSEKNFIILLEHNIAEISNIYEQIHSTPSSSIDKITPNMLKSEIEKLEYLVQQKTPKVKINGNFKDIYFEANKQRFISVLKDLIDNAYTKGGAITRVMISMQKINNNDLLIFITNTITSTGYSIPDDIKISLFKSPISKSGELRFGCFIAGIMISDLGGRIFIKKSSSLRTTIGIIIPCKEYLEDKTCK